MINGTGGTERFALRGGGMRVSVWLVRHLQAIFYTLGLFTRGLAPNLMSAAVVGIALALPGGLYVLMANIQQISTQWDGSARASVFLQPTLNAEAANAVARRLERKAGVQRVLIITPEAGLREFEAMSGFSQTLDAFEQINPLPTVLVLELNLGTLEEARIQTLLTEIGQLPEVDTAQYDLAWLKRFFAILLVMQRGVLVVGGVLAVGVVLIIGNTVRLGIFGRREEIEITKLVGATDAFIRRPFLYTGLWFGLLGGAIAWSLVVAGLMLLQGPAAELAELYGSDFRLSSLDARASLVLVLGGGLLGLAGSWLAVGRHLKEIEPR